MLEDYSAKSHGLLVSLGFDITAFTPVTYQPRRLRGAFSSLAGRGILILEGASRLDAFSAYPCRT